MNGPLDLPRALAYLVSTGRLTPDDDWGPCANTNDSYAHFADNWRGASVVPTLAELNAAWAAIPGLRVRRTVLAIVNDLAGLPLATQGAIWTAFNGGSPPFWSNDTGANLNSLILLAIFATAAGLPAALTQNVQRFAVAMYVQDNPLILVNNPAFPTVNVPGDQPV